MRGLFGFLLLTEVLFAGFADSLWAAGLDEFVVRQALMERFDENRNEKLEALEAKQARLRLRNLMEDKSDRDINIHTWREDIKPLLQTLDPDQDNQLTGSERKAAVALLDRLIPKVDSAELPTKDAKDKPTSQGTNQSQSKLESGNRRYRSRSNGGSGWSYSTGRSNGWSMGGGWGMGSNYGYGSGSGSGLNNGTYTSSSSLNGSFFSGSGLDNANPNKGANSNTESNSLNGGSQSNSTQNTRQASDKSRDATNASSGLLTDSKSGLGPDVGSSSSGPSSGSGGRSTDKPNSSGDSSSPDSLGSGIKPGQGGQEPSAKPSKPAGPTLVPAIPRPGF